MKSKIPLSEKGQEIFVEKICSVYPNVQGIYLYGSWGTEYQRHDSDLDIGVLLHHKAAKNIKTSAWIELATELSIAAKIEKVDLVNLRKASIILCKEIIAANRLIHCVDKNAVDEFEMLTLSFYQELNYHRHKIIKDAMKTGRFYNV